MGRKGKRQPIVKGQGLYEDGTGRSAVACGKEHRFPPHTPLSEMRAWQEKIRKKYKGSGRANASRGTLAEAVDRWEPLEQHLASWKERRAELRAWVALYGDVPYYALDADDVRRAIGIWTQRRVAAKTIRNRLWSLTRLYRVLGGPGADTPADYVQPPAKVRRVITPVTPATILRVYQNLLRFEGDGRLRDKKTRARFMVRAATGRRPKEIMRALPEDVDLERRIWRVRDAKGGWSEGLYLNDDMHAAWTLFAQADAWGDFNTGSMAEVLRAAGWPEGIRPYNLRHSIGIGLSELGHDLDDVGGWLGHSPGSRMTREHYVPVLNSRMQRLSESLEGRLHAWADTGAKPGAKIDVPKRAKVRQTQAVRRTGTKAKTGKKAPKN